MDQSATVSGAPGALWGRWLSSFGLGSGHSPLPKQVCRAKSFADDLVTERGIVNGRVAPCYDPLRLSFRLQICPTSGWCYIREATAASGGAVASLEALLLCLYLGESSAGCATVCDMHSPHISNLCCVSQWQPASQPVSHSTFVHGPGSHLCMMCTMVEPSLASECMHGPER